MTKKISYIDGLKARGLFALASEHQTKCREFEKALGQLLGIADDHGYSECLSDAIYGDGANFDAAMKKQGI